MKNLNADFLLDIWADLKAKRLAPVAVGLAAAVVVMPALLLKGEDTPSAGPLPIAPAPAADTAEVELAEELAERGSKLDSYKAHNPFEGLVKPDEGDSGASGTAIAPGDASAADPAKQIAKLFGGGGGTSPSSGVGGSPDVGSGGGLGTGGGTPEPPTVVRRPSTRYTYQLDIKFGRPGREKRYRHLTRMSFLPSPKVPAVVFMGVPVEAKSALFFVHPEMSHAGEGVCFPRKSDCSFLELRIGREHFLSIEDHEFRMKLLDITRVKLSTERKQREAQRRTSSTDRSGRAVADGSRSGDDASIDWPLLVDDIG